MTLQFDTAVPSGTPAASCAVCKAPVGAVYYTAGKAIVCEPCKTRIATAKPARTSPMLVARAALFGVGGALAGAALYAVVLMAMHGMISYIAIAVAFLVGRTMQFGSGGQRGLPFQIVAVALTYCGIALGYGFVYRDTLSATSPVQAIGFVLSLPVQQSIHSIFGGLIVAIGLWYAWSMNRPATVPAFHGPFKIGAKA
jgi:hypothetical protein